MLQPRSKASYKIVILTTIAALLGLIILLLAFHPLPRLENHSEGELAATATIFPEPRALKPFQLKTQTTTFTQNNLTQHWTLLFFGFTHCSEVCPTTLATLKEVYQDLHPALPELQVVFVSIDPEHDPLKRLKNYVASFNKAFIAATGTSEALKQLQQQVGIFVEHTQASLAHTNSVLLINPQGQWVALFPYGMQAKQMYAEVEKLRSL